MQESVFGKNLKELRREKNIGQVKLAAEIGVTYGETANATIKTFFTTNRAVRFPRLLHMINLVDDYEKILTRCKNRWETEIIGKSFFGRDIILAHIGKNADTLIAATVHSREYVTSYLTLELLEETNFAFDYIPVLNPDGFLLCVEGIESAPKVYRRNLINLNGGSRDFSLWKANGRGVDPNVNFDADWGGGRDNASRPGPESYVGAYPMSEPETRAAAEALRRGNYSQAVAFHSKGEVVYAGYGNNFRYLDSAKEYADFLGYSLEKSVGSCGGLKDYYCLRYDGLGMTVEVGNDEIAHPYPLSELGNLKKRHGGSLEILYKNGKKIAALSAKK